MNQTAQKKKVLIAGSGLLGVVAVSVRELGGSRRLASEARTAQRSGDRVSAGRPERRGGGARRIGTWPTNHARLRPLCSTG